MSIDWNANVHFNTGPKRFLFWFWAEVMVPKVFLIDKKITLGSQGLPFFQYTKQPTKNNMSLRDNLWMNLVTSWVVNNEAELFGKQRPWLEGGERNWGAH